jgi:hypothetical protein
VVGGQVGEHGEGEGEGDGFGDFGKGEIGIFDQVILREFGG